MEISTNSGHSPLKALERLMQMLQPQPAQAAGQDLPTGDQTDVAGAESAPSDTPPPGPPPSTPADRFAKDTLDGLIEVQGKAKGFVHRAEHLISKVDADGDGSLSLNEIADALSPGSDSTAAETATTAAMTTDTTATDAVAGDAAVANPIALFAAAFAKLDTNGDGKISADELATALRAYKPNRRHRNPEEQPAQAATDTPPAQPVTTETAAATDTSTTAGGDSAAA